jgi:hypothetical protein
MTSPNPNDVLSAYYDGEAAPHEEAAAEALLEGSREANRELKDYKQLSHLLQELPRLSAPSEFAAAVLQQAERESLIPLDSASLHPAADPATSAGWRRWLLPASVSISIVAALLIALMIFPQPRPQAVRPEVAQNDAPASAPSFDAARAPAPPATPMALDQKATLARNEAARDEGMMLKAAPKAAAAPSARAMVPALKDATERESASQDSGLVLPTNLKTAKVGDVVEALQQDGQQVAVVRLTVVNQVEGLDGVQSLLVRNTSRTLQNVDEIKRLRQQFSAGKLAQLPKAALPNDPGDMICVYVEGSRDEMVGVLRDLRNDQHIRAAELTNTISFTRLEEYSSGAVAGEKQGQEQTAVAGEAVAQGAADQAPKAPGSQRAVRLSASTVNKILSAGQSTANVARQSTPESNASALDRQRLRQEISPSAGRGQVAKAARRPADGRTQSGTVAKRDGRSQSQAQEVASTQKPFQIFFVITDQAQSQEIPAASPATPAPALAPSSAQKQATPAAQTPAKPAAPNQAP